MAINAYDIFSAMEENGNQALKIMQEKAFTPDLAKTLRTWGIKDASEMIGRSRKTVSDLEKTGTFPKLKTDPRTGRKLYTLHDINLRREHFGTRPCKPSGTNPFILGVINYKGGVGKSETAINGSHSFALKGYRILNVDLDSQGTDTHSFGINPDYDLGKDQTLLPVLLGEKMIQDVIGQTYWDSLDIIPANLSLYNAEFILPSKLHYDDAFSFHDILRNALLELKKDYDLIILDCPPSMGVLSINALYAADAILVPAPPSMFDFSSTIQFFGMAKDVFRRFPDKTYEFIKIMVSKYESTQNANVLVSILRQLFGEQVLVEMMPESEAIKKSRTEMLSIYEVEKYSGSKKTFERVKTAADTVYQEIEDLIKDYWKSL